MANAIVDLRCDAMRAPSPPPPLLGFRHGLRLAFGKFSVDRTCQILRNATIRRHSRYALVVPADQPRIGKPLPNASLAVIPHQKLVDYALDPTHDHGGQKDA